MMLMQYTIKQKTSRYAGSFFVTFVLPQTKCNKMNENLILEEADITETQFFSDTGKYAHESPEDYIAWATLQMQFHIWKELKSLKEMINRG